MPEINPRNFNADHAGLRHTIWALDLLEGETIDLALDRTAWKSAISQRSVRMGDTIEVRTHDKSRLWKLFVEGTDVGWLKASVIEQTREQVIPPLPKDCPLQPRWNVGYRNADKTTGAYDVIRRDDTEGKVLSVLKSGFKVKGDAVAWIVEHLQKMAA